MGLCHCRLTDPASRVVAAIGVACVAVVAGCGGSNGPATKGPASTLSRSPATPSAEARAQQLLEAAKLPSDSRRVAHLPAAGPSAPSQRPACQPLVIRTSTWTVPGSAVALANFLTSHPATGTRYDGYSDNGSVVSSVTDVPSTSPVITQFLVFTFTKDGGHVDLRIDAEVPPADAVCTRA